MPTSKPELLTPVATQILALQPSSVLDIGVGHGKWGYLAREYTDIWMRRYTRPEWKTRIDGIEIYPKYRNPVWDYAYNRVHTGNVLDLLSGLPRYDLCLMLEVLEHFKKAEGLSLLSAILEKCDRAVISYTNCPQGEALGNVHETHRSEWSHDEISALTPANRKLTVVYKDAYTGAYLFWSGT